MFVDWKQMAHLRPSHTYGFSNGGWAYDAYPELETLDAGKSITVADIEGPAVITRLHCTQHGFEDLLLTEAERRALMARGITLEIWFDDAEAPSVRTPLADFFADGCAGRAADFTSPFVEKAPVAYNCFIPMPFGQHASVRLINETGRDLMNYSFIEYQRLPSWDDHLGLFHATWRRFAFQLTRETIAPFFHAEGAGHLMGRNWSIATDEPLFRNFNFVMEGNNEVRIDGEEKPRADYLGSEDSFGFAWGWPRLFNGLRNGINFVQNEHPTLLSTYRYRDVSVIPFEHSLDWRVNWKHEFKDHKEFHETLQQRVDAGGAWVDYAVTHYWYQECPGYPHEEMPSLKDRTNTVLHPNPIP